MALDAFALIILAGLIHAGWNIAAKKAGGDARFAFFTAVLMMVVWAPLGWWLGRDAVPLPGAREWAFVDFGGTEGAGMSVLREKDGDIAVVRSHIRNPAARWDMRGDGIEAGRELNLRQGAFLLKRNIPFQFFRIETAYAGFVLALLAFLLGKEVVDLLNKVIDVKAVNRAGLLDRLRRRHDTGQAVHADSIEKRSCLRSIFQNFNKK